MLSNDHADTDSTPNPFVNPSPHNWQPWQPRRRKIAIVGFDRLVMLGDDRPPFDDPTWEIWGVNMANRLGLMADAEGRWRADRWFDLHERHAQDHKDMAWIQACPCPIYLTHDFGSNPHRRVYPLVEVEAFLRTRFGMHSPYWASSFAYMLALAFFEGAEEIGLYGISMGWGRERFYERGNLEFYVGLALGAGVRVTIPDASPLLRHPARYGFEYDAERDAVIAESAEVMRQFMQATDMKRAFDAQMDARVAACERIREEVWHMMRALAMARPSELRQMMVNHAKEARP